MLKVYDEAIQFYTQKLGFEVLQDAQLDTDKRWVFVASAYSKGSALLLAVVFKEKPCEEVYYCHVI